VRRRGRAIAESGPHRDHDVSSFVTLIRRHGKWHIISIKEGPVVMVTEWMPIGLTKRWSEPLTGAKIYFR